MRPIARRRPAAPPLTWGPRLSERGRHSFAGLPGMRQQIFDAAVQVRGNRSANPSAFLACRSVMRLPGTVIASLWVATTVETRPQNAPRRRAATAHDSCRPALKIIVGRHCHRAAHRGLPDFRAGVHQEWCAPRGLAPPSLLVRDRPGNRARRVQANDRAGGPHGREPDLGVGAPWAVAQRHGSGQGPLRLVVACAAVWLPALWPEAEADTAAL